MKKVLFVGFKPIQLELARKFMEYRGCGSTIEIVPEQRASPGVDAYVVNGDDPSVDSRLALHVRVKPGPVLCIGERQVIGTTVHLPGAFRPVTVDKLQELLGNVDHMAAAVMADEALRSSPKVVPFPMTPEQARAQVLVVDDSEMVRSTMTQKIRQYGHEVDAATNGDDAMAMLLKGHYKLVFLDVMMPGMDGFEVCKRIKRSREYKGCSVYMLTSKDGMFDKVRGSMAGCDGYLVKPMESRTLREVLEKHLGHTGPDSRPASSLMSTGALNAAELAYVSGAHKAFAASAPVASAPSPVAQAEDARPKAQETLESARRAANGFLGLPSGETQAPPDFEATRQDANFRTTFAPTQVFHPGED